MKTRILTSVLLILGAWSGLSADDALNTEGILGSPHQFRGQVAEGETVYDYSFCGDCHVPGIDFSLQGLPEGHLDIASRSCLSCHSGSIASGFPRSGCERETNLGKVGSHTASASPLHHYRFSDHPELTVPTERSPLKMTVGNEVECLTCHDPHDNGNGQFLRMPAGDALCQQCHRMTNWDQSAHHAPQNVLASMDDHLNCASCHGIHLSPAYDDLLLTDENSLCLSCHDGSRDRESEIVTGANIKSTLEKPFIHPMRWNPFDAESELSTGESAWNIGLGAERTVTCSDCHNPHAATETEISPLLPGSMAFVEGVDAMGFALEHAETEYQVCYKCHGQSPDALPRRSVGDLFDVANMSFHPIEGPGNGLRVPSLKEEWSEESLITCSDCHGNDDPFGPQGPHGSSYPGLVKASYSPFPYAAVEENALCFDCHDQRRITGDNGFAFHGLHIEQAGYSCAACHNPHGSVRSPGLLDLNQDHIEAVNGVRRVEQLEPGHGSCTLSCHGVVHAGEVY